MYPSSCSDSSVASGSGSSAANDSYGCGGKVAKRVPGMKTLDSFVTCTGKNADEKTKIVIRKQTATLIASAQLPYRFVEQKSLKHFAQVFVDLGAAYGCVPASDFIARQKTVKVTL